MKAITASELKSGKEVRFNKFRAAYDAENGLYYTAGHFSSTVLCWFETIAALKRWIADNK